MNPYFFSELIRIQGTDRRQFYFIHYVDIDMFRYRFNIRVSTLTTNVHVYVIKYVSFIICEENYVRSYFVFTLKRHFIHNNFLLRYGLYGMTVYRSYRNLNPYYCLYRQIQVNVDDV